MKIDYCMIIRYDWKILKPGLLDIDTFSDIVGESVKVPSQIAGIVSITDASGFGFKHLRAIGLEDGKNMVRKVAISGFK